MITKFLTHSSSRNDSFVYRFSVIFTLDTILSTKDDIDNNATYRMFPKYNGIIISKTI